MDTTTQMPTIDFLKVASAVPENIKSMITIQSLQAYYTMASVEVQASFYQWLQTQQKS